MGSRSFSFPSLFLILVGAVLVMVSGCGKGPVVEGTPQKLTRDQIARIPAGPGQPFFRFGNEISLQTTLKRAGQTFSFPAEKDFPFFVDDFIENVSAKETILTEVENLARFTLKPDTAIQIHPNALTLIRGQTRFEFKKVNGEYKIRIPFATLGIRGTSLDVGVNPDQSSRITMLTGAIVVEAGPRSIQLKGGEQLDIDSKGTAGQPQVVPGLNPDTVHPAGN